MFLNGKKTLLKDFRRISAYVEQDDALVGSLTVRETMYFAAQLSLPRYGVAMSLHDDPKIRLILFKFGQQNRTNGTY